MVKLFVKLMSSEFEMSLVGELSYFLGLQIKETNEGTFISQAKYLWKVIQKFELTNTKHQRTPIWIYDNIFLDEARAKADKKILEKHDW